jgi:hypothetical protein
VRGTSRRAPGKRRPSLALDPATGRLTRTRDTPWPLDARVFYTVAESGAITATGAGPADSIGIMQHDCTAIFEPATKSWTDTKRCKAFPEPYPYRTPTGARSAVAYRENGLSAYRNGAWEQVTENAPHDTSGADLTDGIALDAHHAVAADGTTHEVVTCAF